MDFNYGYEQSNPYFRPESIFATAQAQRPNIVNLDNPHNTGQAFFSNSGILLTNDFFSPRTPNQPSSRVQASTFPNEREFTDNTTNYLSKNSLSRPTTQSRMTTGFTTQAQEFPQISCMRPRPRSQSLLQALINKIDTDDNTTSDRQGSVYSEPQSFVTSSSTEKVIGQQEAQQTATISASTARRAEKKSRLNHSRAIIKEQEKQLKLEKKGKKSRHPKKTKSRTLVPIPTTIAAASEADRMIWKYRHEGRTWEEISAKWEEITGTRPGKSSLSVRWIKLCKNFGINNGNAIDNKLLVRYKKEAEKQLETELWKIVAERFQQNHQATYTPDILQRHYRSARRSQSPRDSVSLADDNDASEAGVISDSESEQEDGDIEIDDEPAV